MCLRIVQLCELHLELTLRRHRMSRKNIKNNHGSVHDLDTECIAEILHLRRGELIIRRNGICLET